MSHLQPRSRADRLTLALGVLLGALATPRAAEAQTVPGGTVSTYATVTDPVILSFGPDGSLYVGCDPNPAGSSVPVHVKKVGPGGSPVTPLGNVPINDADTSLLDVAGTVSGVPGTLIVGGLLGPAPLPGRISGILPDGNVVTLWDNGPWSNPIEMKFDLTGRFLFTGGESRSIWVSTGGSAPTILATLPGSAYPTYLTIATDNRIVVGSSDNVIRVYNPDGSLANGAFASFSGIAGVEYAPGGAFGTDLYVLDAALGTLVRVSPAGAKTTVGTGFATGLGTKDIAFGPGGDLFVSWITADKVLRITKPWTNLGFALAGSAGLPALAGTGALAGGDPVSLDLSSARPSAPVALIIGFSQLNAPFKGGTLVPANNLLIAGLLTSPGGTLSLPSTWPVGLPSGLSFYFQEWITDPAGPKGFAASNGLRATTP